MRLNIKEKVKNAEKFQILCLLRWKIQSCPCSKKKKKKKAEECIMYVTSHKNWILKLKTGTRKLKSSEDLRICLIRPGKLQGRA